MEILHVLSKHVEQDLRGNFTLRCHVIDDLVFANFDLAQSVLDRSRKCAEKFTLDEITNIKPGDYDG